MNTNELETLETVLRSQLDNAWGAKYEAVRETIVAMSRTLNRDGVPFDFVDRLNFRKHCGVTW